VSTIGLVLLGILAAAAVLGVARVLRGGRLGDRAVGFDLLSAVFACALLVTAAETGDGLLLDLAVTLGLLGFLTSVTVARYLESRSGR
jgi:multicomponent Na+:H+ antiporter subunit F